MSTWLPAVGMLSQAGWRDEGCLSMEQGWLSLFAQLGEARHGVCHPVSVEEPALGSTDRQRAGGRRQRLWHHPKLPPAVWEQPGLELPGAQHGCCPRMQRSVLSKWFLS